MLNTEILSLISLSKSIKDRISYSQIFFKWVKCCFFSGFLFACKCTIGQVNLSGKSGLLYIPNATAYSDGAISFGYNYNPLRFHLRTPNPEQVLFANLTILPRLTITATLLQPFQAKKNKVQEGIGDRQIDISYLLIKEKTKFPSVAVIISSPFMIETAMLTNVLVATKHFNLNSKLNLETTVGYGSPYILFRKGDPQQNLNLSNSNIFSNLKFQKKSSTNFNNNYLIGPFGGLKLSYQNKAGLMTEWDSQHLNVGMFVTFWKKLTIQGGLLNGDQFMFGSSFHIQLLKPKKSITKIDEKVY